GKTFDARARTFALGDDTSRGLAGLLEKRRGKGGAGPLFVLQGLQRRLSRKCGCGDVQSRIPLALLGGPRSAAPSLSFRLNQQMGSAGRKSSMAGQRNGKASWIERNYQKSCGNCPPACIAAICRQNILSNISKKRERRSQRPGSNALAGHVQ